MLHASDLSMKAKLLDQKHILLIQGTADEVVHQQHSLWLAKALIQNGITYRQQVLIPYLSYLAILGFDDVFYV